MTTDPFRWLRIFAYVTLLLLGLWALPHAHAQNIRFDGTVTNRNGVPVGGASIAVCTQASTVPAIPAPCATPAPLCSSLTDTVCTSPNPVTADALGNYSGYTKPGTYTLQFYGSGLTTRLQPDQNFPCVVLTCKSGDLSGFLSFATVPYINAAVDFMGILNRPLQAGNINQLNGYQILMQDDSGTIPNEVALYSTFIDNHTTGTRLSNAGFEADVYNKNSGTTNGQVGVIGYAETDAGTITSSNAVFGNATVKGGTVTSNAGISGICVVSGGTVTNCYAGLDAGPSITGGTVTNVYGRYIQAVGTPGSTRNYQFWSETDNVNLPWTIRHDGFTGIGTASPGAELTVSGAGQSAATFNTTANVGGTILLDDTGTSAGNGGAEIFSASTGIFKFAAIKGELTNGGGNSQGNIGVFTRLNSGDATLTEGLTFPVRGGAVSPLPAAGLGYSTGAGCAVTQATNKATGVACTGMSGAITLNNANLAATTSVGFTVTDTSIAATDVVIVNIKSGATADSYQVTVDAIAGGSFRISIRNFTGGGLAEAVVLNFAIIRAVAS